ncbi:hypothetical protein GGR56DRAFT_669677 [Xylariaceae sp. FL0804]|nr:hypothetical protein GGR56DRAFT_669677 [Xylariaceae sp. FL0804]
MADQTAPVTPKKPMAAAAAAAEGAQVPTPPQSTSSNKKISFKVKPISIPPYPGMSVETNEKPLQDGHEDIMMFMGDNTPDNNNEKEHRKEVRFVDQDEPKAAATMTSREQFRAYIDSSASDEQRGQRLRNSLHAMYPSDDKFVSYETFISARGEEDNNRSYERWYRKMLYRPEYQDTDSDYDLDEDPVYSKDGWQPKIGDAGIDTQEDLDMVLGSRARREGMEHAIEKRRSKVFRHGGHGEEQKELQVFVGHCSASEDSTWTDSSASDSDDSAPPSATMPESALAQSQDQQQKQKSSKRGGNGRGRGRGRGRGSGSSHRRAARSRGGKKKSNNPNASYKPGAESSGSDSGAEDKSSVTTRKRRSGGRAARGKKRGNMAVDGAGDTHSSTTTGTGSSSSSADDESEGMAAKTTMRKGGAKRTYNRFLDDEDTTGSGGSSSDDEREDDEAETRPRKRAKKTAALDASSQGSRVSNGGSPERAVGWDWRIVDPRGGPTPEVYDDQWRDPWSGWSREQYEEELYHFDLFCRKHFDDYVPDWDLEGGEEKEEGEEQQAQQQVTTMDDDGLHEKEQEQCEEDKEMVVLPHRPAPWAAAQDEDAQHEHEHIVQKEESAAAVATSADDDEGHRVVTQHSSSIKTKSDLEEDDEGHRVAAAKKKTKKARALDLDFIANTPALDFFGLLLDPAEAFQW